MLTRPRTHPHKGRAAIHIPQAVRMFDNGGPMVIVNVHKRTSTPRLSAPGARSGYASVPVPLRPWSFRLLLFLLMLTRPRTIKL